jgi:streptogramin lyase
MKGKSVETMRRIILVSTLAAMVCGCSQFGSSPSAAPSVLPAIKHVKIEEFSDLPGGSAYYFPTALTAGSDGQLWIADDVDQDYGESAVARVSTSAKLTRTYYYYNSASPAFEGIAQGSDGAYWLTDWADGVIVRLSTHGKMKKYAVKGNSDLSDIVAGPDGALWFAQGDSVGRITTTGRITIYGTRARQTTYLDDLGVEDITVGPDGALWFTKKSGNAIGRITTAAKLTEYTQGISAGAGLTSIAPGPDGALWFTEMSGGRIGRITTKGSVTEYTSGISENEQPVGIAAGPDGAMWFTEYEGKYAYYGAKIGRITMRGRVTEYSNISSTSGPTAIVQGPDRNMWFVETSADKLGRVDLAGTRS